MNLARWVRTILAPILPTPRIPPDTKFNEAIQLTEEVAAEVRERVESTDPFRAIMADLILRKAPPDAHLVAAAYEAAQEADIYKGNRR